MNIVLKFKTLIGGHKCEIQCNLENEISKYLDEIKKQLGFDTEDNLKFTQYGKQIKLDTLVKHISKNIPIGVIKQVSDVKIEKEEFYSIEQIHKILPFIFLYFKIKDPVMFKLFTETSETATFLTLMLEPKYRVLIDILMRQSGDIVKLLNAGITNIKVELPDSKSLEKLAEDNKKFLLNDKYYNDKEASFNSSDININKFNENDIKLIQILESYVITYEAAKEIYINNNRDLNDSINFIINQQNSSTNNE